MKFITLFLSLLASTFLLSTSALAHTDHMLGDGSLHTLYHGIFWGLFAVVVYKIYLYFKAKKANKSQ